LLGLFASFPSFPFPSFGFPALPVFKNSSPSFQKLSSPLFAAASKGSGGHQARAACAAPMPALLPTLEGLGQRHAHGGNGVYTILGFFSFFLFIFLFLWGSKNGLQQ
jgi:hypothetical protein